MNFEITNEIINELKPYISQENITIKTDNKDWKNRNYKSDYVTIDEQNSVGFEVMENEIIIFYFTDHRHFEDYSFELEEGDYNYIERAKLFLCELFRYKLQHIQIYKGKKLTSEKYFIIYPDDREPFSLGTIVHLLSRSINPFFKKTESYTIWHYDKNKGHFTYDAPKVPAPNAIEVIDINDNCYIEIYQKRNTYTFDVMEKYYDEYSGNYWAPAINIIPTGIYDTKERAIKFALEAIEARNKIE